MKMILYSLKVCLYQIRIMSKNYKIYTIPVCLFIFMKSFLDPFREFLIASGEKATPFLFPFFLNGKFCAAVVFAGILLFFVDAPFYDKDKLFVMIRCGRAKWVTGHFFYIIFVSIGYMLCWVGISVLMLIPRIDFSNEWGRVWTTLALTDKAYELGLSFYVTPELVMNYQPVRAFFLVFGMGCLICIFYGLCMWLLNIYLGKIISFAVIMASVLLVTRVEYMPPWMIYLVPSGWADVGNLSAYTAHGLSINKANLILIIGSIFLGLLVYWKTIRIDIAKG